MNMTNGKDYCVTAAFENIQSKANLREGTIKSASIIEENRPCTCSYCLRTNHREITKQLLNSMENQLQQSRMKNKGYEKTTKMLRLLDNERSIND